MNGMTATTFSPGVSISRGMIVTILYRISGSNEETDPVGFSDVPEDSYYYYPIGRTQDNLIATGFENGTFRPNDAITKEQFVTFLYRYTTEYENVSFTLPYSSLSTHLSDYSSIQPYARPAVNWAMNVGILAANFTYFYPANNVSRGLGADFIHRFMTLVLGNARAVAIKGLSISTAKEISEYMCDMWYDASYKYDLYAQHIEYAFYNSEMIYTHSHGLTDGTGIGLMNGTTLTSANIDAGEMYGVSLVYVSACHAGADFCEALVNVGGAGCSIGFTTPIRAYEDDDGIHQFNLLVFNYLNQGYAIDVAIEKAGAGFTSAQKDYFGISSLQQYGDYERGREEIL